MRQPSMPGVRPPPRDGVSPSRVGVGSQAYDNVAHFLAVRFPSVQDWPQRLARGDVLDAQGQPLRGHEPCANGMLIWYWRSPPPEQPVPFEVQLLHQDEQLVVVDKPHFLPVTPGGRHLRETVLVRLKQALGIETLAPMHRLDRETAGVLVFTVQPSMRSAYHALLQRRAVHKTYEAIAPWREDLKLPLDCHSRLAAPTDRRFMQTQVLAGEPNAHTKVELISLLGDARGAPAGDCIHKQVAAPPGPLAHYRLLPSTGRKHQLRAQMNALGLPIVGDRVYPVLWPDVAEDQTAHFSQPLQLLAREFSFKDPFTSQWRQFISRRRLALER